MEVNYIRTFIYITRHKGKYYICLILCNYITKAFFHFLNYIYFYAYDLLSVSFVRDQNVMCSLIGKITEMAINWVANANTTLVEKKDSILWGLEGETLKNKLEWVLM